MEAITASTGMMLQWVQPKMSERRFELRAREMVFASLEFQSMFGSLANAAAESGNWTFKRVGFFNPRVTVRNLGEEKELVVYRPDWTGIEGRIDFTGGAVYGWKPANFWATHYSLLDAKGEALVLFKQGIEDASLKDVFKVQARVEIQPAALLMPDMTLLVVLGWYLMILQADDSAATTAAVPTVY